MVRTNIWKQEKTEGWKTDVIIFALLLGFGFFINRNIEIKGLYMDDLYLWSCYGEQSFAEYVFPVGGTRFRFIFYLISYLLLGLIGTHITAIVPLNIILNCLVAFTIFRFGKKLGKSAFIGFLCGISYLLSRMSYYQIGQMYGLMETLALWAAIGILYCLYMYLNEDSKPHMIWANILYFCICFIHERYLVLLPVFFLVLLLNWKREWKLWFITACNFVLVMAVRVITIGTISPAGTAGTDVADTFQAGQAIKYALSQAAYVFGINAGPDHLNGLSFEHTPAKIKLFIFAADFILIVLTALFSVELIRRKKDRRRLLSNLSLFVFFIMMCIGSSSVTIRVEMRWVYVSFGAALLLLAYMIGETGIKKTVLSGMFFLYLALSFVPELFYRDHFPNLYLWPNQLRYNSLAEQTYEKYGDAIFGKTIYIVGDSYEMSDFTARTFFKVYDRDRKAEGTNVEIVDSIRAFGQVTDDMLVLTEDPAHNGFTDITAFVRNEKCEIISGYYRDGWMDQKARIRVMAGASGRIAFEGYYPEALEGGETIRIQMGETEKETMEIPVSDQTFRFEIQAEPYQTAPLSFDINFCTKDAKEQRGQEKMAVILNIMTD